MYNPATSRFVTEDVYTLRLYLITYWDNLRCGGSDLSGVQFDSPTVLNLTDMLKALLCMRNNIDIKKYAQGERAGDRE